MLKHLSSSGLLILFLLLALAQADDSNYPPPSCEEIYLDYLNLGYSPCQPIVPAIERQNSFVLTVRDKQTGEPLEGIYVQVVMNFFGMEVENQCEKCFARLRGYSVGDSYPDVTDASGRIDNLTDFVRYDDLREVHWITFRIEDLKGKYAATTEYLRFPPEVSHSEITAYLLNNEQL